MKEKTRLTIKHFLIRKAKEVFPILLWGIAIFTPMIIAENFFGFDFSLPWKCGSPYLTPCIPFDLRIPFLLATLLVELVLYLILSSLWNWLKVNWFLARIEAQTELRKKRKKRTRK